jgi:hypothetical protein
MSTQVHRNTDSRTCGATTIVSGQSNVYVNNLLASVQGDRASHGDGALGATVNDGTVWVNNKKLVLKGSNASPDMYCRPRGGSHCNPKSVGASSDVYACGGGSGGSIGGSPDEAFPDPSGSDLYPDPAVQRNADGSPLDGDKNADGTVDQTDQNFDDGSSPGYPDDLSNAELEQIIRDEAVLRGINPDTAVAIYRAEGAGSYQSTVPRNGSGSLNGREASFGPYQLYTGAGLGNEYETATGRTLTQDNTRDGVTNQVRFALDEAARGGWGPWYGRGPAGVGEFEGVSGAQPIGNWD